MRDTRSIMIGVTAFITTVLAILGRSAIAGAAPFA